MALQERAATAVDDAQADEHEHTTRILDNQILSIDYRRNMLSAEEIARLHASSRLFVQQQRRPWWPWRSPVTTTQLPIETTDDAIFHVPTDDKSHIESDSGCLLAAADVTAYREQHALTPRPPLSEILYTASILVQRCNCPVDVVNTILAFAGLFVSFENETHVRVDGHNHMDDEYLRLELPSLDALALPIGVTVAQCVSLVVEWEATGRDGTSEWNRYYPNPTTWIDVSIQRPEKRASALTGGSNTTDDPTVNTNAVIVAIEVARVCAFTYLRWTYRICHHMKQFVEPMGLVRSIALGDAVCLLLRSEMLQWNNTTLSARVHAMFALQLNEAFSSAAIPFPDVVARDDGSSTTDNRTASKCCLQ